MGSQIRLPARCTCQPQRTAPEKQLLQHRYRAAQDQCMASLPLQQQSGPPHLDRCSYNRSETQKISHGGKKVFDRCCLMPRTESFRAELNMLILMTSAGLQRRCRCLVRPANNRRWRPDCMWEAKQTALESVDFEDHMQRRSREWSQTQHPIVCQHMHNPFRSASSRWT